MRRERTMRKSHNLVVVFIQDFLACRLRIGSTVYLLCVVIGVVLVTVLGCKWTGAFLCSCVKLNWCYRMILRTGSLIAIAVTFWHAAFKTAMFEHIFVYWSHNSLNWMSAINRYFPKLKEGNENNEKLNSRGGGVKFKQWLQFLVTITQIVMCHSLWSQKIMVWNCCTYNTSSWAKRERPTFITTSPLLCWCFFKEGDSRMQLQV